MEKIIEMQVPERLVGKQAPDFKMPTAVGSGDDFGEVKLSDYKGKWLVLFFYPLDFTFVWPTELRAFSERYSEFEALNASIIGASTDSEHSHRAWINGNLGKLNYPLASDRTRLASRDYGVLIEEEGIALRGLYIINPEGVVQYVTVHDLDVGRSVDEVLRVLKAIQTKGLVPADWKEGDKLL